MRLAAESEIDTIVLLNLLAICKEHRGSYNENNIQVLVSHATPELEKLPKSFNFNHFYHAQNIIPVWNHKSPHYSVFLVTARQRKQRIEEERNDRMSCFVP